MHETAMPATGGPLARLRELPDRELVARLRAGEQRAFEPVMRRYNRRLFRAARGIVGSDTEAEDVVQETYVRAYQHLDGFRGPDGLGAWLTRIAVNEALMRRRRPDAAGSTAGEAFDEERFAGETMAGDDRASGTPEEATANAQLGGLIERCVDRLPEAYRLAFILREIEQLSVAETAASLEVAPVTVKTRVHRAKRLLRRTLSKELRRASAAAYPFAGRRCDRTVETVFRRLAGSADPGRHAH